MTCAHVRLLGPCFKTGRVEDRPIRHWPEASRTVPTLPTLAVGRALTKQSTPVVTSKDGRRVMRGGNTSSALRRAQRTSWAITPPTLGPTVTFPATGFWPHGEPVVAIDPRKVHQSARRPTRRHWLYSSAKPPRVPCPTAWLNPPGRRIAGPPVCL